MKVILALGDVIAAEADALLMTIDGTTRSPGGAPAWGKVGQVGRKTWPEFWKKMERELNLPIVIGEAQIVDMSESGSEEMPPWRYYGALSSLDHLGQSAHMADHLQGAVLRALGDLAFFRVRSIVSTIPSGGWRVKPEMAAHFVEAARRRFVKWDTTWTIYERYENIFEQLSPLAEKFGWSVQDNKK
jgi:hypothetical protein|tara:strand:- start:2405 stop:2965 length:561 start_codon:yes stop_codon:yes gene_type:complete